jgi:26S proteasome regulatory subunit N10
MKRNNVAVDVINFAHPENEAKLRAMVTAANSNGNSHFLDVPMGVSMITDVLIASPIINEGMDAGMADVSGGANAGGAGVPAAPTRFEEFGGIDPNLDPELAMALRISMEEERARQHQPEAAVPNAPADQPAAQASAVQDAQMVAGDEDDEDLDEEAILARALMLSTQEAMGGGASHVTPSGGAGAAQETPAAAKVDAANDMKELLKDNEFM